MPDILAVQRRLTEWFIAVGPPAEIILIPEVEVKEPGRGIKKLPGEPRDPQIMRKIFPGGDGLRTGGQDGTIHRFDVILLGLYDCVAEIGDTWQDGDQKYYIHSEYPQNGYERKFGLYSFGGKPKDG